MSSYAFHIANTRNKDGNKSIRGKKTVGKRL
jgi:hypothetical protein